MKRLLTAILLSIAPLTQAGDRPIGVKVEAVTSDPVAVSLDGCIAGELAGIAGFALAQSDAGILVRVAVKPTRVQGADFLVSAILMSRPGADAPPGPRVEGYQIDDVVMTIGRHDGTGPLCRDIARAVAERYLR